MRNTFANTLLEIARKDSRVILLTGDLGFSVFEPFMEELPNQYINCGVMEQSMTGIAAGLATEGQIPFIYSILPFSTMRNFEQIRNDLCYQGLHAVVVGVGAGFSYGPYGHTHHGLEDLGILRTIPILTMYTPGDPVEVERVTTLAYKKPGPSYIRIGKTGEPILHKQLLRFQKNSMIRMKSGTDVTIFGISTFLSRAIEVANELEKMGVSTAVYSVPVFKPFDRDTVVLAAKETKAIITIEEHSIMGGLGSSVAEVLAERGAAVRFLRIGVPDHFTKVMGLSEYMREANGLSVIQITERIKKELKIKN